MKKKHGVFLGFTIMVIMVIITVTGCEKNAVFPSGFRGTWKRDEYPNTLTLTSKVLKSSSQSSARELMDVSGDTYTMKNTEYGNVIMISIKLRKRNLEISGDTGTGQDNWNGTWKKQSPGKNVVVSGTEWRFNQNRQVTVLDFDGPTYKTENYTISIKFTDKTHLTVSNSAEPNKVINGTYTIEGNNITVTTSGGGKMVWRIAGTSLYYDETVFTKAD